MAFVLPDRVMETTTTTGAGTLTLDGAVSGYRTFAAVGNGNTTRYVIEAVDAGGTPTGEWETGIGTYTSSGTTLSRDTIQASSNSGSAVSLSSGTKRVFVAMQPFLAPTTITGNTTLDGSINFVLANNTADIVVNLPPASDVAGQTLNIIKISNNTFNVTLNATIGEVVNPQLNFPYSRATLVSNGSGYQALTLIKRDELRFNTGNGNGTTATKVRRFSTVETNVGTAFSYNDSSANGTVITINETGTYSVNYYDGHASLAVNFGVSRNSTQTTTAIQSITATDRVGMASSQGAGAFGSVSMIRLFRQGDVIRPHLATTPANDTSNGSSFQITRVW